MLQILLDQQSARLDATLRTLSQQLTDQKTEIQSVNEELSKKIDAIPDVDEKIAIAKVDMQKTIDEALTTFITSRRPPKTRQLVCVLSVHVPGTLPCIVARFL